MAVVVAFPHCAEIVTLLLGAEASVVTVNVADVLPAGTVTPLAGTFADCVSLEVRVTATPPVGAGPLKVTVPTDESPAATLVGLRVNEVGVSGPRSVTLNVATLLPIYVDPHG